ncbi:MAG: PqqD family peptide modification chaperone [Arenicellales bacterium]
MSLGFLHKTFELGAIPVQCEDIEVNKIPCCWLLNKAGDEKRVKLNDSSMMIWQLCEGKYSVGELIDALQAQYPDAKGMDKDIQRALDELLSEALITMRS